MKTVWKYQVLVPEGGDFFIPKSARLLHVACQNPQADAVVTLWFEVDPSEADVARHFIVAGTGMPIPADGEYVGTAIAAAGALVWHVYEVTR